MWTNELTNIVYSHLLSRWEKDKNLFYGAIKNTSFTRTSKVVDKPVFPTVLVKKIAGVEQGRTLDGKFVNATLLTIQIEVTDNRLQNNADEVSDIICEYMKDMRFEMASEPIADESDPAVYRTIARYRRVFGASDILDDL